MTDLTLETLAAQVAELREENSRFRAMLSLYGADPEKADEWFKKIAFHLNLTDSQLATHRLNMADKLNTLDQRLRNLERRR